MARTKRHRQFKDGARTALSGLYSQLSWGRADRAVRAPFWPLIEPTLAETEMYRMRCCMRLKRPRVTDAKLEATGTAVKGIMADRNAIIEP